MRASVPAFLLTSTLLLSPATAQDEQVPLEVMRREAESAIAKLHEDVEQRVASAVAKFAMVGSILGSEELEGTRASLVALGAAATPTLMRYFSSTDRVRVLDQIALVLDAMLEEGSIEGKSLVPDMSRHVSSKVTPRAVAAIDVLGHTKVDAVKATLRGMVVIGQKAEILAATIRSLGELGDTDSFDLYEKARTHASADVRLAAMETYGRVGRVQDVGHVIDALEDRDDRVAYAAIGALERLAALSTKALFALHDQLEHRDKRRVQLAIGAVKRIGNAQLSRDHLRRVVSRLKDSDFETAKQAAIALYTMRDTSGRDELAKPYKRAIDKNARVPRYHVNLAEFYLEFGDYKSAVASFKNAIKNSRDRERGEYQVKAARCYAYLGKLRGAADLLRKVFDDDWSAVAADPAFEKLREDRRYAEKFVPPADR